MHPNSTHLTAPEQIRRAVVFNGTSAIAKGQAFTYQRAFTGTRQADGTTIGAATAAWERDKYVQKPVPSATYEQWFAGVAEQDYPATSSDAFREITLLEPNSYCQIATLIPTTVGVTRLSALAAAAGAVHTAGRWIAGGFPGRGSALAMQTVAAITSPTDYTVGPISSSLDGSATLTISGTAYTLTKTGAFAGVPRTANLQGNEYVHIVAGATDNAGGNTGVAPTPGRYLITACASDNAVTLDPAGTAPAASSVDCAFYCVRGNPLVWARLDDCGRESGLVEWISPATGAAACPAMVGGFTYIFGGFDLDSADATDTLADGTYPGQRKGYKMIAAITTSDWQLTVTTGQAIDVSQATLTLGYSATALTGLEFDGASDTATLEWNGSRWNLTSCNGPVVT